MATFYCNSCGHSQSVNDALVGKNVKCPKCGIAGVVSADGGYELAGKPTKNCPFCDEEVQENAKKCKHCGEFLETRQLVVQPTDDL